MSNASSTTVTVNEPAEAVFATITDVDRLPAWNAAITKVIEQPPRLEQGGEWVVEVHALGDPGLACSAG
jgi:uncharacterized protein YndB with AHSA1/START domain